jgi:hypothetical protein
MSTKVNRRNTLYGYPNPQAGLQQEPIVAKRDPLVSDAAEIGSIWVNTVSQSYFILCSSIGGVNTWTSTTGGSEVLTALTVNPGNITVTSGDVNITAGDLNMAPGSASALGSLNAGTTTLGSTLNVTGAATFGSTVEVLGNTDLDGNLDVTGNVTVNGDFDLTSAAALSFTTTSNTNPAISFTANGGALETIVLTSTQGTSADSIELSSALGGISLNAGSATGSDVTIASSNAAGGIVLTAGTGGIELEVANGPLTVTTGTGALNIGADAFAKAITIGNVIGATSVAIQSGTGGIVGTSTGFINFAAGGGFAIAATGIIGIESSAGIINIGNNAVAQNINIGTGAAARVITIGNVTSTTAVAINCGTVGLNLGTSATAHPTAVGSTTAGSTLVLNTPTGTNIAAANGLSVTTTGRGLSLPGGLLVLSGTGDPNGSITAPIGSLYLRSNPVGATSRAYINTDAGTTWTNITCAA